MAIFPRPQAGCLRADRGGLGMKKFLQLGIFLTCLFGGSVAINAQTNEQIEASILGHLDNLKNWSYRTGTSDLDALDKENQLLKKELLRYGQRASTLKYDFPALAEKMFIPTSKDQRLRIYSWDNQEGGSGRIFETVFQYADRSGKTHTWSPTISREGLVCAGFYHQIFQTDTPSGRLYLANSSAACSTSLAYQDLSIFRIDGEKLNSNLKLIRTKSGLTNCVSFEYDFFSTVDHPERPIRLFFFDESAKSFRFPVVVEDKKFLNGGRVTDKFITFRFNGKYFVKIS